MIRPHKDGTLLKLYIQPGASKSSWEGIHGERMKIRIKSPPVDGAANKELLTFIAKVFSISKSRVHLLRGESSRQKDVWVELSIEEVQEKLSDLQIDFKN